LKTALPERVTWVRIPLPPPLPSASPIWGPAEKRPSCRLQKRYSSSGDALKGHNEAVALAKGQVS
jgi:hypothetical protein